MTIPPCPIPPQQVYGTVRRKVILGKIRLGEVSEADKGSLDRRELDPEWLKWVRHVRKTYPRDVILAELRQAYELTDDIERRPVVLTKQSERSPVDPEERRRRWMRSLADEETLEGLGAEFGVHKASVSKWLSGTNRMPSGFSTWLAETEADLWEKALLRYHSLWLALCPDELTFDAVDARLIQVGMVGDLLEDGASDDAILALTRPLAEVADKIKEELQRLFDWADREGILEDLLGVELVEPSTP